MTITPEEIDEMYKAFRCRLNEQETVTAIARWAEAKTRQEARLQIRRITFFVAWYDLWIGAYYDRDDRIWYVCPLPCCVIRINLS